MAYPTVKVTPNGESYTITNLWDEAAFQLIVLRESIFGGVKSTVTDIVNAVTKPVSTGLSNIGKSLTSWIPILVVALLVVGAVYFVFLKGKAKVLA
jgi:hypothetical protein